MKTNHLLGAAARIGAIALSVCFMTGAAPAEANVAVGVGVSLDFNTCYTALQPYGSWYQTPEYGYVWVPAGMPAGWRPYTRGQWINTDTGWMWQSSFAWGWLPFHYGRWTYYDAYGWSWVPGYEWAPAWVTWYRTPSYVGWAPLAPVGLGVSFAIQPFWWSFVSYGYFASPNVWAYGVPYYWVGSSVCSPYVVVNNYYFYGNRYWRHGGRRLRWYGPPVHVVERNINRRLERYTVASTGVRSEHGRMERGRVEVYRPAAAESIRREASASNARRGELGEWALRTPRTIEQPRAEAGRSGLVESPRTGEGRQPGVVETPRTERPGGDRPPTAERPVQPPTAERPAQPPTAERPVRPEQPVTERPIAERPPTAEPIVRPERPIAERPPAAAPPVTPTVPRAERVTPQPMRPTPQPITPQPVTPQPMRPTPQPITPPSVQPVRPTPQPIAPQPVTPQPMRPTPQPIVPQPVTPQPMRPTPQPIAPQPVPRTAPQQAMPSMPSAPSMPRVAPQPAMPSMPSMPRTAPSMPSMPRMAPSMPSMPSAPAMPRTAPSMPAPQQMMPQVESGGRRR